MKMNPLFVRAMACIVLLVSGAACTNDFGTAGAGLVDAVSFETNLTTEIDMNAYSIQFDGVQTNTLSAGALGHYKDPVFGDATVSALSQVVLSRFDPDFGNEAVVDSVVFTLPYFSNDLSVDSEGATTYELDSIFRNTGPMRLSVFRSNYFLNALDPDSDFEDPAVYYSNEVNSFPGVEGDLLLEIEEFEPSAEEIVLTSMEVQEEDTDPVEVITRNPPALRAILDSDYFKEVLVDKAGSQVLLNQNNFAEYFRGIYIKAEPINGRGSYLLFNYTSANITVFYSFTGVDDSGTPGDPNESGNGSISLNFGRVQTLGIEQELAAAVADAIPDTAPENGTERLYLKGGNGAIALIDLFPDRDGDGIGDQLDLLRSCNVIINEANLTLYVDQEAMEPINGVREPERLFIFDFDNNSRLIDNLLDNTTGIGGAVNAKTNHLGRLVREEEGDLNSSGVSYRIRLTRYINDILLNEEVENTTLALTVSQNILDPNTARALDESGALLEGRIPASSVLSQEGTILHGVRSTNENKRLKLRLFYTLTDDVDPNSPCGQLLGLN